MPRPPSARPSGGRRRPGRTSRRLARASAPGCRRRCRVTVTTLRGLRAGLQRELAAGPACSARRCSGGCRTPARGRAPSASSTSGSLGSVTLSSWPRRVDQRAHARDRVGDDVGGAATGERWQAESPAADARHLEQIVDEPHELAGLPRDRRRNLVDAARVVAAPSASSSMPVRSARADCAARGRAARGTRPCAGPPRAAPARALALGDVDEGENDALELTSRVRYGRIRAR